MRDKIFSNLKDTGIFIFVKFVATIFIVVAYALVSAWVQYLYVSFFGENTLNYIVGGLCALLIGILVCHFLGNLVFMFVRGWHMAALAHLEEINRRNLPVLEASIRVFFKHFTTFASVFCLNKAVSKLIDKCSDKLAYFLKDLKIMDFLGGFMDHPIVKSVIKDLYSTLFDCIVYCLVKNTKAGLSDDVAEMPNAIKTYLKSIPKIAVSSVSIALTACVIPRVIKWVTVFIVLLKFGVSRSIPVFLVFYPIYFILEQVVFEPIETIILVSCFSDISSSEGLEEGNEEQEGIISDIVAYVMQELGANADRIDDYSQGVRQTKVSRKADNPKEHEEVKPDVTVEDNLFLAKDSGHDIDSDNYYKERNDVFAESPLNSNHFISEEDDEESIEFTIGAEDGEDSNISLDKFAEMLSAIGDKDDSAGMKTRKSTNLTPNQQMLADLFNGGNIPSGFDDIDIDDENSLAGEAIEID